MLASTFAHAFTRQARGRLLRDPPSVIDPTPPNGDHDLEFTATPPGPTALPKMAAVLVPIVLHEDEATVLLTQRAPNMRAHSGQIAFPGGRVDEDDATPLAAALREAEEEIGLERDLVQPLGYLDAYLSASGYLVTPVVAMIEPRFTLRLNPLEVADAFEVPLAFLLDPNNYEVHAREWKGRIRQYYAIPFRERYIWGITAGILRNLSVRLYEA